MRSVVYLVIGVTLTLSSSARAAMITDSVEAPSSAMNSSLSAYQALNDGSTDLTLYAAGFYGGFSFDLGNGRNAADTGASSNAGSPAGSGSLSNGGSPAGSGSSSNAGSSAESGSFSNPGGISDAGGAAGATSSTLTVSQAPDVGIAGGPLPVPLPGSALMLGAALVAFGVAGFNLKRRTSATSA